MRIVVNDIAASEGGALSVLEDLYSEIVNSNDENEWLFLLGDHYLEERQNIKVRVFPKVKESWIKRLIFDLISGRKIINDMHPDIYLSLQNTATLGIEAHQYVFLHQPLPYQREKNFSLFKRAEYKLAIYQHIIGKIYSVLFRLTKADIIVQTEWMKNNLISTVRNNIFKVKTKININQEYIEKLLNKNQRNSKAFFYPASKTLYKNHEFLIKSFSSCKDRDLKLYLTLSENEIDIEDDRIILVGKISRKEVFELYSKTNLIFPSSIETLGLPLLEAQCFSGPILALDTQFARESLNTYPNKYFFNLQDADSLTHLIERVSTETYTPVFTGNFSEFTGDSLREILIQTWRRDKNR